jgi:hypothetical protein
VIRQCPVVASPTSLRIFSGFLPIALASEARKAVPVIEDGPKGLKEEVGDDTEQV